MDKDANFQYVDIYSALLDEKGSPDIIYFEEDGLHLNSIGYQLLSEVLIKHPEIFPQKIVEKIY